MKENKLRKYINKNFDLIFKSINDEILKDVGEINKNYFSKLIEEFLALDTKVKVEDLSILPYLLLTFLEGKGKMDYTSLRADTISLKKLNAEASVYYNYAKFYIENEFFYIDLMQMKIGGMPIDKAIVKYSKKIPIKKF